MKFSSGHIRTNKNAPKYDSVNATLLTKAGYIDQVMAGVYSYLPLGYRVLKKIEQIVREEMDTIGSEIFMPTLAPVENWQKTRRFEKVSVLLKAVPANDVARAVHSAEYVVGPTHEEIVTPLVRQLVQSYKDLPIAVYQIQSKFRNEPRAKSGLLRGREFRMKDLYSFHADEEDFRQYYERAKEVYMNVFRRLGLGDDTLIALASGGDFTEEYSHEFQTRCETGEDTVFRVPSTGVAYNKEVAPSLAPDVTYSEELKEREDVLGRGIVGVEELAKFLGIPVEKTTKTMLFETPDGQVVAAAVRGGYSVNEYKLCKVIGAKSVRMASPEVVRRVTGAEVGYAGIIGLPESVRVVIDDSCRGRANFETGANRTDYHTVNANFGRDIPEPERFYDIKEAKAGDRFPDTGEVYEVFAASEVGNIFPLGTKFADDFGVVYADRNGVRRSVVMGCYGIGTSRLMGILAEKFHDDRGIIWPDSVAPFHAHLVTLPGGEEPGEALYQTLTSQGIEVLWDDRTDVSAGAKFADADLIGIPFRLVVSGKTGGKVEWKQRSAFESELATVEEIVRILSR